MFLTVSCGDDRSDWHGSTAFSTDERLQIQQARDWIDEHTVGGSHPIWWDRAPSDHGNGAVIRAASPDGHPPAQIEFARIYLDPSQYAGLLHGYAAHEWGHSVGMCHLAVDEPGVMNPFIGSDEMQWTENDEREWQRVLREGKGSSSPNCK